MESFLSSVLLFLGLIVLVGSLDDIVIDVLKWWKIGSSRAKSLRTDATEKLAEKPSIAIFVANWHEADILGSMVERNLANFTYERVKFVLGVYPNDTDTAAVAMALAERFPHKVEVVVNRREGPTSKGQMLNEMFARVFARDRAAPDLVVMHDSEDIISPRSFEVYALEMRDHAMIQIPIFSLDSRDRSLVAATYMEEFAERHSGEMLLRERLGSFVPSAGVGTCLRKDLIQHFIAERGYVLQSGSVTEDYVLGAEAHQAGFSTAFAAYRDTQRPDVPLIATLEFFPKDFWSSLRQRTRWTFGIGFESAKRLGWFGSGWNRFFLYRDRKGAVANFLPLVSLAVLAACLIVSPDFSTFSPWQRDLLIAVLAINSLNIVLRVYQKATSLKYVYGGYDLLGLLARWPVALLINAMAAGRAWHSFIVESGLASKPIAWAKTQHELPASFQILGARAAPGLAGYRPAGRRRASVGSRVGGSVALACLLLLVAGGLRIYEPLMPPVTEQVAQVLNPQEIDAEERQIVEGVQMSAGLEGGETQTASVQPTVERLAQLTIKVAAEQERAELTGTVPASRAVGDASDPSQDAAASERTGADPAEFLRATATALAKFSVQQGSQQDAALIANARPAPLGDAVALLQAIESNEPASAAGAPATMSVARLMESRDEILLLAEAGLSAGRQMDLALMARSIFPSPDQNAAVQLAEADAAADPEPVRVVESRDDLRKLAEAGIAASRQSDLGVLAHAVPAPLEPQSEQSIAALSEPDAAVDTKAAAAAYARQDIEQLTRISLRGDEAGEGALMASTEPAALAAKPKADNRKWRKKLVTSKAIDEKVQRNAAKRNLPAKKKAPVQFAAATAGEWATPGPKKGTTFLRRPCQGPNCGLPGVGFLSKAFVGVPKSN